MNSRKWRKIAAKEHNDRIDLTAEIKDLRIKIFEKHRVSVATEQGDNNAMQAATERLRGILESDTPPAVKAGRNRSVGLGRHELARIQLAVIAAMAGISNTDKY